MYSVVDIAKSQHAKSKFKVFHKISVLFGYSLYFRALAYIQAISSHTHPVVGIGRNEYVKRKFMAFHKISVNLGYF